MNYPTLRFVFDRKKTATKKKKGLIQIEALSERKRKYISTSVKVYSDQWNERRKVVNSVDMDYLNSQLDAQMGALQIWIKSLMDRGEVFDFAKMDLFLDSQSKGNKQTYIDYIDCKIESASDIAESTKKTHRKLLNSLRCYGKIKYFSDLNTRGVRDYDNWLHSKGYAQATIHSFHKMNKKYLHMAMADELIEKDPYVGFKIDRGKTSARRYLTKEELESVKNAYVPNKSIDKVRDLFLFQCYTGMAYADMAKFDFSKVVERNGKMVLLDTRQKTEEQFYIVLLPPVIAILEKYGNHLPLISCQQYNLRLKVVADYAGLDRNITSHMGRHTFAVMCLSSGIKMESISKMLGHTSVTTTQLYARVLNSDLERDFSVLEEFIRPVQPQ